MERVAIAMSGKIYSIRVYSRLKFTLLVMNLKQIKTKKIILFLWSVTRNTGFQELEQP